MPEAIDAAAGSGAAGARRTARRTTSSASRWRAPAARRRRQPSSEGTRARGRRRPQTRTRAWTSPRGARRWQKGDLERGRGEVPPRASSCGPTSARSAAALLDRQRIAEAARSRRTGSPLTIPTRVADGRRLHPQGQVRGGRAAARASTSRSVRASSWGWYALGYSQFAQQKIGESIKALAKSLAARHHERRGAQDPRPQPDDHRPVRRRADRVRAGDPLQAGLGGDALQPRQAASRSRTTGSRRARRSKRRSRSTRRTSKRWTRSGFALEALGDDAGAVASYEKAIALNEERQGPLRLART